MPQKVQLKNGHVLTIDDFPFASGGEGDLHRIIGPAEFVHSVVKIYKPAKQTRERERKINFLTSNAPDIEVSNGHHSVVWADKAVYADGQFIGFTMHLAPGVSLELLCHSRLPEKLGPEWRKFDFANPNAIGLRQKICFNIAVALHHVHAPELYVLVDFKPDNVIIKPNGLISIIDTDSVQVQQYMKLLHPAPVVTPEFTPPEYYKGIKPEKTGAPVSWDMFSLGVIFYRLLCGLHPFVGTCNRPFEHCVGYDLKIEHGLFPNGKNRSKFRVIPKEHDNFRKLGAGIQKLFIRCFDDGHVRAASRPSIEEWCQELAPGFTLPSSRRLPSALTPFPVYQYAKEIIPPFRPEIVVPAFDFPELPRTRLITHVMNRLGRISEQGRKKQELINATLELNVLADRKFIYEHELRQLIDAYGRKQQALLKKERQEVDCLKAAFLAGMAGVDNNLKQIISLENKAVQSLRAGTLSDMAALQQVIAGLQKCLIDDPAEAYEAEALTHKLLVQKLEDKRARHINSIANSNGMLSKFVIAQFETEIFNTAFTGIVDNLADAGIVTAADFIEVRGNGEIRKANGTWVKIVGIGATRALMLKNWRSGIRRNEDLLRTQSVALKYDADIKLAHSRFVDYEHQWQLQVQPKKKQFSEQKAELERQISAIKQAGDAKSDELKAHFDKLCADVEAEAAQLHQHYSGKAADLSALIQDELKLEHAAFLQEVSGKMEAVRDFLAAYVLERDKLSALYQEAGYG